MPLLPLPLLALNLSYDIFALYSQSILNPLQLTQISKIPLCIGQPFKMTENKLSIFHNCFCKIGTFDQKEQNRSQHWCTSNLTLDQKKILSQYLKENTLVHYAIDNAHYAVHLGPNSTHVYTNYTFIIGNQTAFSNYFEISTNNPVSINSSSIDFDYSILYNPEFVPTRITPKNEPIYIILFILFAFFWIMRFIHLLFTDHFSHSQTEIIPYIPNHSFYISILTSVGFGCALNIFIVFVYSLFFSISGLLNIISKTYYFHSFISTIIISISCSLLCKLWHVDDMASALFFSPIVLPLITFYFLFSIQWILIGQNSCAQFPLRTFFMIFASAAFIRLPVGAFTSLLITKFFKPPQSKPPILITIFMKKRSPILHIIFSGFLLYITSLPIIFNYFSLKENNGSLSFIKPIFKFIPLLLFAGFVTGISVIRHCQTENWGVISFLSGGSIAFYNWLTLDIISIVYCPLNKSLTFSLQNSLNLLFAFFQFVIFGSLSTIATFTFVHSASKKCQNSNCN